MSRRHGQRSWDAVRAQIAVHLARCEVRADQDALTADEQRIFRIEESEPYYGPTRDAGVTISRLLGLDEAAAQQAWEAEIDGAESLNTLADALGDACFDTEERSAITLLLLDALDRGVCDGAIATELLARIRWHLRADARVQSRMRYWWSHMEGGSAVMAALN